MVGLGDLGDLFSRGRTVVLRVQGMACEHCVKAVERRLTDLDGVLSVDVSLDDASARLSVEDHLPIETLPETLRTAGYEAHLDPSASDR